MDIYQILVSLFNDYSTEISRKNHGPAKSGHFGQAARLRILRMLEFNLRVVIVKLVKHVQSRFASILLPQISQRSMSNIGGSTAHMLMTGCERLEGQLVNLVVSHLQQNSLVRRVFSFLCIVSSLGDTVTP